MNTVVHAADLVRQSQHLLARNPANLDAHYYRWIADAVQDAGLAGRPDEEGTVWAVDLQMRDLRPLVRVWVVTPDRNRRAVQEVLKDALAGLDWRVVKAVVR